MEMKPRWDYQLTILARAIEVFRGVSKLYSLCHFLFFFVTCTMHKIAFPF